MDSSNSILLDPLDYVLKGYHVEPHKLTAEQWLELIDFLVTQLKPLLNYMEGFTNVKEPSDLWEHDRSLAGVPFVTPVPDRVLCREIAYRHVAHGLYRGEAADLLIDRDGHWIDAGYRVNSHDPRPYWMYIEEPMLRALLVEDGKRHPNQGRLGHRIFRGLTRMTESTLEQSEKRLTKLRNTNDWLHRLNSRLYATR